MLITKNSSRCVYMYKIIYNEDEYPTDNEDTYNIATPVDLIQANLHNSTSHANNNSKRPPTKNNTRLSSDAYL